MEDQKMKKINQETLKIEDGLKIGDPAIKDRTRCFFCQEPLTSDDFKLDRIEETKNFIAHSNCVTKAIMRKYF